MRPLTVLTGVLLGSSLSIAVSLAMVLVAYLWIGDEYPRLQYEFRPLVQSTLIFLVMTMLTAGSFYTLLTRHRWRVVLQVAMWLGFAATAAYYWP